MRARHLRLATWNIHGGVGRDGKRDLARILRVLREIDADVIALQEVPSLSEADDLLMGMRQSMGLAIALGRTVTRSGAEFGNAIGSRYPYLSKVTVDLTIDRREPRNAIDVRVDIPGIELRVMATHLGLRPGERRRQVRRLLLEYDRSPAATTVLMGDINEWFLWGRPLRWLHRRFGHRGSPSTYPARAPVFALDRIWSHPPSALSRVAIHRSATASMASDHLPLTGLLWLGDSG